MPLHETRTRDLDGGISTSADWVAPSYNDPFSAIAGEAHQRTHEFMTTEKDNIARGIAPMTPAEHFDQNTDSYIARTASLPPEFGSMEDAVRWYRDNQIPMPQVQTFQDANAVAAGVAGEVRGNVAETRQQMLNRGFSTKLPLPGDQDAMEVYDRLLKHKLIEDSDPELEPAERVAQADYQIEQINQEMLVESIRSDLDVDNPDAVVERGLDNYRVLMGLDVDQADWVFMQAKEFMEMGHDIATSLDAAYETWSHPADAE